MTATLDPPVRTSDLGGSPVPGSTTDESSASTTAPTIGTIVASVVVVMGALIGAQPLRDNSFLTHLATGRLILADGLPAGDPYSATASGEPWVVQSWLASVIYGTIDALTGPVGLRILMALTVALLAGLTWKLADAATSLIPRLALAFVVVAIGSSVWDPRPLLFGLIGVALVLLAVEGRLDPRWLLPTMWLWVNLHGSFPLGVMIAIAWWLGTRWSGRSTNEAGRVVAWTVGGVIAGAVSPLGPRLLMFPVQLLSHSEHLAGIKEWQSPDFATTPARLLLLMIVAAVLVLCRRPDRRDGVMVALAIGLALMASRNTGVAALILVPVLARGLGQVGTIGVHQRSRVLRVGLVAVVALGVLTVSSVLQRPSYALSPYPIRALAWLEDHDLVGQRQTVIATRDYVGNLETLLYGADAGVFIDDRYDMYPEAVIQDSTTLLEGGGALDVLDRREIDVVLWDRGTPLADLVTASPEWGIAYTEDRWIVACRRPSPDGPATCTG